MSKKKQDYKQRYVKGTGIKAREGKQVYITEQMHKRIVSITYHFGEGNVTIADFLHNVLEEHFNRHHEEIAVMYEVTPKMPL